MNVTMIGCGGIGSFLLPALVRLHDRREITVMDGDHFTNENLDRQLFDEKDVGFNKAAVLSRVYHTGCNTRYYSLGMLHSEPGDILMVCADNNKARAAAISDAESYGLIAIVGGNETYSSNAYVFVGQRGWRRTQRDPLVRYPNIGTDESGDPMAIEAGCVEAAQSGNTQLVSANMMAAAQMAHLFSIWVVRQHKLKWKDMEAYLPYELGNTMSGSYTLPVMSGAMEKAA